MKKQAAPGMVRRGAVPAHEQVFQALRLQILYGDLAPGQSVTIQGLTETLGAGMTPVREAIRRLIAAGALTSQGNRRVSVPVLTESDISQLLFARKSIETELARRAARRVEAARVRTLEGIDTALDAAIAKGDVVGYLTENHRFHSTIYEQAGAPILTEIAERLWLRFGPSLRVVCGRMGTQSLADRHKDMLAAMARGDAELAALAMERDVEQGMDQMQAVLFGPAAQERFD
ncbi:MAG TPA: GntR family transcriptional regulator [Rhodobacteraceae bacterium]|nr:GntR family transcriptional regulator [Paracoccaceae bacterium]